MVMQVFRAFIVGIICLFSYPAYAQLGQVIPRPMSMEVEAVSDTFKISRETQILILSQELSTSLFISSAHKVQESETYMGELHRQADILNEGLELILGYKLRIQFIDSEEDIEKLKGDNPIVLSASPVPLIEFPGTYMLMILGELAIIFGHDYQALSYGIQSLLQLLQPNGQIQSVVIQDQPRFSYRGVHLDVSRHFFDKAYILHLLDLMARYKLNVFHWHLVDGGGWRFPSDRYPKLTKLAAFRTVQDWDVWWNGGDRRFVPEGTDGAYGGYYTKEDIREIVRYAADRFITIIPEIEIPGHSNEVFAAYPELRCPTATQSSEYCIGNDSTFIFLEAILDEVMELFPSQYIHIGGDEVSSDTWMSCPRCKQRMQDEGLSKAYDLQTYCIHRVARYLREHGRTMVGWDEIMNGTLPDSAVVMSWRSTKPGLEAARKGHFVVMTPGEELYLNHYQAEPTTEPQAQSGYITLDKVYRYNPAPDTLPDSVAHYIIGSQACLWTEYIDKPDYADYMYLPRLLAHAESCWLSRDTESDTEAGRVDFLLRANRETNWLRSRGINAYPLHSTTLSMRVDESKRTINVFAQTEKVPIDGLRYTTDGSKPTLHSKLYNSRTGIAVVDSATVSVAPFVSDTMAGPVANRRADYHKAIGAKVKYDCKIYPDYRAGGTQALVDGYRGGSTYMDGRWQGFIRPIDLTIDLGQKKKIQSVSATFMQIKSAAVEMPQDVEVLISADGEKYHSLGLQHSRTASDERQFMLETFEFRASVPTSTRYIRFVAKQKPGSLHFLFTDEIIVW